MHQLVRLRLVQKVLDAVSRLVGTPGIDLVRGLLAESYGIDLHAVAFLNLLAEGLVQTCRLVVPQRIGRGEARHIVSLRNALSHGGDVSVDVCLTGICQAHYAEQFLACLALQAAQQHREVSLQAVGRHEHVLSLLPVHHLAEELPGKRLHPFVHCLRCCVQLDCLCGLPLVFWHVVRVLGLRSLFLLRGLVLVVRAGPECEAHAHQCDKNLLHTLLILLL